MMGLSMCSHLLNDTIEEFEISAAHSPWYTRICCHLVCD